MSKTFHSLFMELEAIAAGPNDSPSPATTLTLERTHNIKVECALVNFIGDYLLDTVDNDL